MSSFHIASYGSSYESRSEVVKQQNFTAISHCPSCILPVSKCKLCLTKKALWNHVKNCIADECTFSGCIDMSNAISHYSVCKGCKICNA